MLSSNLRGTDRLAHDNFPVADDAADDPTGTELVDLRSIFDRGEPVRDDERSHIAGQVVDRVHDR